MGDRLLAGIPLESFVRHRINLLEPAKNDAAAAVLTVEEIFGRQQRLQELARYVIKEDWDRPPLAAFRESRDGERFLLLGRLEAAVRLALVDLGPGRARVEAEAVIAALEAAC